MPPESSIPTGSSKFISGSCSSFSSDVHSAAPPSTGAAFKHLANALYRTVLNLWLSLFFACFCYCRKHASSARKLFLSELKRVSSVCKRFLFAWKRSTSSFKQANCFFFFFESLTNSNTNVSLTAERVCFTRGTSNDSVCSVVMSYRPTPIGKSTVQL